MLDIVSSDLNSQTVRAKKLQSSILWTGWFMGVIGLTSLLGLVMFLWGPSPNILAWLIFLVGAIVTFLEPRYGVYLIMFWGLMGDGILTPWFPFVKNLSSSESIMYVHDAVIISPLEIYMGITFISWFSRAFAKRKSDFYAGSVFWPVISFTVFILFGMAFGLLSGGDLRIALWEGRAIFYLPIMMILVSNLIVTPEHAKNLMWLIIISLFVESISGIYFIVVGLNLDISSIQSITEHSAAIHMNTFFLFLLAVWLFKGSIAQRFLLPLMLPFVLVVYVATQRRAAFLTLGLALFFALIILYKENAKLFWLITPPLALSAVIYLGVFWNAGGALGLPAQAVKAVIAPDQATAADRSSDLYRVIENVNSSFTIHVKPLTGVGFGNKFFMIVPLPDISFFEFWEYITHNSIVWIWMKTGIGGFLALLLMIGWAILRGVRLLWEIEGGSIRAIILVSVLYLCMHFLYAYVDMSWDAQSMLYVGTAMGLINSFSRLEI